MKTFKITEIVGWHEDSWLMDGDASHEGYAAVEELLMHGIDSAMNKFNR